MVYLPKILIDRGLSTLEVGILYAIIPFTRLFVPLVLVHFLSIEARFFGISLIVFIFFIAFLQVAVDSFALLFVALLGIGISTSIIPPYSDTLVLSTLGAEEYGKVRLFGSLGFVFSVYLLAPWFLEWEYVGAYLFFIAFMMAVFGWRLASIQLSEAHDKERETTGGFSLIFKHVWLWLSILFFQMSFGGFYNFFTVYGIEHDLSSDDLSKLWIFGVACEVVMLWLQSGILRSCRLLLVLQVAILSTFLRWLVFYFVSDGGVLWYFAQSLHALSFALYHSAMIAYLFTLSGKKSLTQQLYSGIGYGIGMLFGSVVAGWLYGERLFLWMGVFAFLSWVTLWWHSKSFIKITRIL
ncbi:MAG: MFS transporter [Wolinella sp.]